VSFVTPWPATLSPAYDAARAICRHHARSFFFASHFLPRPKRDFAYAVYGFCRLLDDAADERPSEASVRAFVDRLESIYHADRVVDLSADPLDAFADTVRRCEIPKQYFLDLAEGCRQDFVKSRYTSWAELERYCYLVAGVVGLMMCRVFGLCDPSAVPFAVQMGNAMQLTNILRDVGEDFRRGRVYLPADEMTRFGYDEEKLAGGVVDDSFRALMRFQIDRARSLYRQASVALCQLDADGSRQTACTMAVVYAGILNAIERQRFDVFSRRARVSTFGKILRIRRARLLARVRPGEPIPDVF
jgi:15-cis-phytoene synthase